MVFTKKHVLDNYLLQMGTSHGVYEVETNWLIADAEDW